MKNMAISKKLLVTFGIIIILLLLTVAVSIFSLMSTAGNFSSFYSGPYEVSNMCSEMGANIEASAKYVGYATMTDSTTETQTFIQGVRDELATLTERVTFVRTNGSPEMLPVIDSFDAVLAEATKAQNEVLEYAGNNDNTQAARLFFNKVRPLLVEAQGYLDELNEMSNVNAADYYNTSDGQKNVVLVILILLSCFALLVTILLATYITKSLTRPIHEIEEAAKKLAEGDMSAEITYESKDELGSLSNSVRAMMSRLTAIITDLQYLMGELAQGNFNIKTRADADYVGQFRPMLLSLQQTTVSLSDTMQQINLASEQVASGSDQVASGSQALSQGATEQASSIEELAATINEIAGQVAATADNAKEARAQTDAAENEVAVCNQQMNEMISAMKEISDSSAEIGKIIKTIEDIAFQTNILALNAAVEAARAGVAGKGFAVVADEVRSLASKSAEASKNTSTLIDGATQAVQKGMRIADATAGSLTRVVDTTQAVNTVVDKISVAAGAQAESINQVTQGVDQISSVVQTNSATAEESAATSEELTGQAQMLKDLVGRFKLRAQSNQMSAAMREEENDMPEAAAPIMHVGKEKY